MRTIFRNFFSQLGAAFVVVAVALALHPGVAVAMEIEVVLAGNQEMPPNGSVASGMGKIVVSTDRTFTGSVTVTGLTGSAGHIHEGAKGVNGPVIIPLIKSGNTFSIPDGIVLTDSYHASLLLGNLYVNIHSPTYPGGEIRGQIVIPLFH